jgi:predicted MFS family arabinose efflux permease
MPALIVLLSMVGFIVIAAMRVTDPLLPVLAQDFGMSVGRVGMVVTAFAIPYGLCQLVYGPAGDRYGKLHVVTATLALSALFIFASAFAPGIETLTALRFLSGALMAATVPLSMAFIADNIDYTVRQATLARYLGGLILGQIMGGGLGGVLADLMGWRRIFLLFGVTTAVMAALLWSQTRHRVEPRKDVALTGRALFRPYLEILRDGHARGVLVTVAIEGFLFFGAMAYVGAYIKTRFAVSYTVIGLLLTCFGLGGLVYAAQVRRIIPLLGERGMLIAGALAMACCYSALGFAPAWPWVAPALVGLGFGFYMMHNTLQLRATELAPQARGTAVALFAFSLFAGQGTGVALLGAAIDRVGYQTPFLISGIGIALLGLWYQSRLSTPGSAPDRSPPRVPSPSPADD